jgi:hypothetical protein
MSERDPDRITRREHREIAKELRYMRPENIAKDFKSPRERAAIAAVFKWLSLNASTAWELKRPNVYTTVAVSGSVNRTLTPYQACVIEKKAVDKAERLLVPETSA